MNVLIRKNNRGFTLIEILISIFILSIGIVGILLAFPLGVQVESNAKMRTCASKLAQEKIEEAISLPYEDINSSLEDYETISEFQSYKRETNVDYYDPDSSLSTTTNLGVKMIEVKVFWNSSLASIEKNINFKTLIHE